MKKLFGYLLVVAVLVSCMAVTAFAAVPGDTVSVIFSASGNPGFASYGATLDYDHSALELVSYEAGPLSVGGFAAYGDIASYFGVDDVTGDGVLFTATFKVKEGTAAGTYPVAAILDELSTSNAADDYVTFAIVGGSVTVEAPVCDHIWGEGEVTKAATCTEDGVKTYTCTICGETKTEAIPADGHSFGEWKVTKAATCTEKGVETRECACGEKETREIPVVDHALNTYGKDETHHWLLCDECDYTGEKEVHEYDYNGVCVCGATKTVVDDPNLDDVPKTGDITPYIILSVVSVLILAAAAVFILKRKAVK